MKLNFTVLLLAFIIILGLSLRLYKITSSPYGIYIDEASIGYNAYSIITTGRDQHGKFMPLFFYAFGEYKLPVYIYLVAYAQILLGPTDLSVRLPAAILGSLTIAFMYLLGKEFISGSQNKRLVTVFPWLSAILLAVSPWHFQFTHAGFEASAGLFFVVLGLYFFFKAKRLISTRYLIAAVISFVTALYTYNSARIVVPVTVLLLLLIYGKFFKIRSLFIALLVGIILSLPFFQFSLSREGMSYPSSVTIFYQFEGKELLKQFIINYWQNISPSTLFFRGETTIARNTPHRMSLLYLLNFPFFLVGLGTLIKNRSREFLFLLTFWFLAFIPPAITTTNPHALRGIFAVAPSVFIVALGLSSSLGYFKNIKISQIFLGCYILLLSVSVINFLNTYHGKYIRDAGRDWQVCIKKASLRILEIQDDYDAVYIEDTAAEWISYLWYLKYDPEEYQRSKDKDNLGKYHFGKDFTDKIAKGGRSLYVTRKSEAEGELIEQITYPNDSVAISLRVF